MSNFIYSETIRQLQIEEVGKDTGMVKASVSLVPFSTESTSKPGKMGCVVSGTSSSVALQVMLGVRCRCQSASGFPAALWHTTETDRIQRIGYG